MAKLSNGGAVDPDRLNQVLSVAQMRKAEQALIDAGTFSEGSTGVDALMQTAGRGAGEWVRRMAAGRPVTVLCGPGNNGGDGYVIAQALLEHGNPVQLVPAREPATEAARNARALYGGAVLAADARPHGDVLVDCLFGSGLARALPEDLAAQLRALAASHLHRIAIDVPSGIESDSGAALNPDLPAWDLTVALGAWKFAHLAQPASAAMGMLKLVDIGVAAVPGAAHVLARPRIEAPPVNAHKYTRGLVTVIGGAMPGAPLLSAEAAMRAGAGYVKLVAPQRVDGMPPDLVFVAAPDAGAMMRELADRRTSAVLIGPGQGRDERARTRLSGVLSSRIPAVIDADALMLLSPGLLPRPVGGLILTPHDGEMTALENRFGLPADRTRPERALAMAQLVQAVVVFKGPQSIIASPSGVVRIAPRAPSWLSVAGSGDVLAGIMAARLAVTCNTVLAAKEALWLHGEAARLAGPSFTASQLIDAVREAMVSALV
ncbi:NAD(P)H-hydrate dehydratase [Novosphingobium sp.]|uniref:NAD(P)H-hydrate dehydratase n=1 Tax=Novosphingobium sp. TaxID=1874826 RepID=UPI0025E3055B|nr:NAD(P)H-hydrate dehydratase [Novosphingobium sp.]